MPYDWDWVPNRPIDSAKARWIGDVLVKSHRINAIEENFPKFVCFAFGNGHGSWRSKISGNSAKLSHSMTLQESCLGHYLPFQRAKNKSDLVPKAVFRMRNPGFTCGARSVVVRGRQHS